MDTRKRYRRSIVWSSNRNFKLETDVLAKFIKAPTLKMKPYSHLKVIHPMCLFWRCFFTWYFLKFLQKSPKNRYFYVYFWKKLISTTFKNLRFFLFTPFFTPLYQNLKMHFVKTYRGLNAMPPISNEKHRKVVML